MQVRAKLAVLELISGLFGWGWIIASIAALYFLVMAIGFEGEWSSFFWAVGAGVIAKWLARGFEENKRRIGVENQTDAGMSPENKKNADRRLQVISDFGQFLEANPSGGNICDASELPHPKEEILDAIFLQLVAVEDENLRSALEVAAITLADFQEGVGSEPLSPLGIPVEELVQSKEDAITIANKIANNANSGRYETFKAKVNKELIDMKARFMASEQLRNQMPLEKKREILG